MENNETRDVMNTEAEGEEKLPFKPRLKRLVRRTVIDWNERSVATYASSIAFFFSISIIPMIIILLQFLPYAGLSQLELLSFIEQLIPETVYWLAVRVIAEAYNRSVTVLSASAVVLIWSASRGTMALRWGLNRVYGVKERRRYPVLCLLAIGYTAALLVIFSIILFLIFAGPVSRFLAENIPEVFADPVTVNPLRSGGAILHDAMVAVQFHVAAAERVTVQARITTGQQPVTAILLEGLSKLEYRGYDSAGLAVRNGTELAEVVKSTGKLYKLAEKTDNGRTLTGTCGIGHTRWATHGEPSQTNAHPHVSGNCQGSGSGSVESDVVGVHNGIIENYQELKEKLLRHGYQFYSQTDTEVVIKLIDYYYKKYKIGPIDALAKTMVRVRGSYALEVMFKDYPNEIYVARKDSPMIIGIAEGDTYVASDVPAILNHTRQVYYIDNLEMGRLVPGEAHFYDLNGDEVEKECVTISFSAEAAEKGGYEHFMMKEIHEQPRVLRDTFGSAVLDDVINLGVDEEALANILQLYIVACGSAYHAGIAGQYVIEDLAEVPVRVELASYVYRTVKMTIFVNCRSFFLSLNCVRGSIFVC